MTYRDIVFIHLSANWLCLCNVFITEVVYWCTGPVDTAKLLKSTKVDFLFGGMVGMVV